MNEQKGGKKNRIVIGIIALVVVGLILAVVLTNCLGGAKELSITEFWADLDNGLVKSIEFSDSYSIYVTLQDGVKNNSNLSYYQVVVSGRDIEKDIRERCEANGITIPEIVLKNPNSGISISTILSIASLAVTIILIIFIFMSISGKGGGQGNAFNFGKTKTNMATNVKVRFSDVAGAEEEKTELKEIVDFLKNPKKYTKIGAKIPRGVLLVGPPGTGKTLFAKAVAGEANVPFFSISGSDFVEMFVGVGASRVRDLFQRAKQSMPCIVFIDEIDAVGRQRGSGIGGGNDEREQTLNQLLVQMDGFETNDGIIVMAATNRADILDPALMRPGRFDRQIYVNTPDVKGREEIFKVHSRNKPIASDVDFRTLARLTSGFSGADIANLLNEAAILAARDNRQIITMKDVTEGINKVIAGPQKKSRIITEADRRITAYHESGHAIVGKFLKYCDDVQEVSIIPRGMAAGYTISRPKNDNSHITYNKLNDEIAMLLGGRAAEEVFIQDISTGASNDIQRATNIARKMVAEWGMSDKLPNLYYGGSQEVFLGRDYQQQVNYSDEVAKVIDEETKKLIESNYNRALEVITSHKNVIEGMVKLLYENETIYSSEVDMLIEGKSIEEIQDFLKQEADKLKAEDAKKSEPIVKPIFDPASTIIIEEKKTNEVQAQPLEENEKKEESKDDTNENN